MDDYVKYLLTTAQAARRVGVTQQCLRSAIHRKRLKAYRRGSRWLVHQSDLMDWYENCPHVAGRPPKGG